MQDLKLEEKIAVNVRLMLINNFKANKAINLCNNTTTIKGITKRKISSNAKGLGSERTL